MNITGFLLARIDEDEARSRKLALTDTRPVLSLAATVNHPERLLAEAQAKRAIIKLHNQTGERWEGFPRADELVNYCTHDQHPAPCDTLRTLAAVYSDHPDYNTAWRID